MKPKRVDEAWLLKVATFAGLAVLAQVAMVGGLNAVGITLAVESTILGLWAAFIAVKATEDAKAILDAVEGTRATARDLAESAKAERDVLDRLLARDELELLRQVQGAAPRMWLSLLRAPGVEPTEEIRLSRGQSKRYYDALHEPLRAAEGIELPECRLLLNRLFPLTWAFGGLAGEDRDLFNFYPLVLAADTELRNAIAERVRLLRSR